MTRARARILVADDSRLDREILSGLLTEEGYEVSTAPNGEEALASLANVPADLVLLDIVMPVLDGEETCRRIKADSATAEIPVLMVTGIASPEERLRVLSAGADDFLTKPVDRVELVARVGTLLRIKQLHDRLAVRDEALGAFAAEPGVQPGEREGRQRILLVEDDPDFSKLFVAMVRQEPWDVSVCRDGRAGLETIEQGDFDIVVLDLMLPEVDGLEVLRTIRRNPDLLSVPVLIMTALGGTEDRVTALEAGADDFVSKPVTPSEMRARIRSLLRKKSLLDTMARNYRRALDLSAIDSLTGLFNHGYFYEYIGREIQRASRYHHPVSLMMLDIDRFKDYNDTCGHPAGDRALRDIARIIQTCIRRTDLAARYGGEEFTVVLPETTLEGTRLLAERIRRGIEEFEFPGEQQLPRGKMTVSIGIAIYPDQADSAAELVSAADKALYSVKREGGNLVREYGGE